MSDEAPTKLPQQTEGVAGTVPCGAFDAQAQLYRPVSVVVRRRRSMAVLPAKPPEHADVLRNLLFPIHPKAVFVMEAEGGRWDGYFRSWRGIRRRRGGEQKRGRRVIAGKVTVVDPCLKPDGSGMILRCANGAPIPVSFPTVSKTPRRR